jgi:hypothetical protein
MASIVETPETEREQRARLLGMKADTGQSWAVIAQHAGIAQGTLSTWATGNYAGDTLKVAAEVRRYLDTRASLAAAEFQAVQDPGFLETTTALRLWKLLRYAQTGKIVAIAGAAGIGKTTTSREYQSRSSNVWIATQAPSSAGLQGMLIGVLAAMGQVDARGVPQQLSARILARMTNARGLLIVDEAQELSEKALDEIRSWHDACGVGIALVGDERVIGRFGGLRRVELARLHSRIAMRHIQRGPDETDIEIVARGWGVSEPSQLRFLKSLAGKPGALRGIVRVIEAAANLAAGEDRALSVSDLKEAWDQANTDRSVTA